MNVEEIAQHAGMFPKRSDPRRQGWMLTQRRAGLSVQELQGQGRASSSNPPLSPAQGICAREAVPVSLQIVAKEVL